MSAPSTPSRARNELREAGILPDEWRLFRTAPANGSWNMACDLTMLAMARDEQVGFLRVYGWSAPTVSFGRNERTTGIFSPEALASAGLAVVRRPTGGRALLHHREVTYSVTIPMQDDLRWQHAYAAINRLLQRALAGLGVPAVISEKRTSAAPEGRADSGVDGGPSGEVCFSGISEGELAVGGRKLVASSVWRERGAYLQHGSIPVFDDQPMLLDALGGAIEPPAPAAVLSDWLVDSVSAGSVADQIQFALEKSAGECGITRQWSIPDAILPVIDGTREKLERADWLWRR